MKDKKSFTQIAVISDDKSGKNKSSLAKSLLKRFKKLFPDADFIDVKISKIKNTKK